MSLQEIAFSVVGLGVNFLYGIVKDWWNKRKEKEEIEENESEIEQLKNELEALKNKSQLVTKGKENFSDRDVKLVNEKLSDIKRLEGIMNENVTTERAFHVWVESQVDNRSLDLVEIAEIFMFLLQKLIDKAQNEGMSSTKVNKYKDQLTYVEINLGKYRAAQHEARNIGGVHAASQLAQAEKFLRTSLRDAKDFLKDS